MPDCDLVLVGRRGTITIPKRIRLDLGIEDGARLRSEVVDGAIVLRPVQVSLDVRQRRRELIEATNQAYARLRADPAAWERHLRERAEWDVTLLDGLDESDG